MAKLITALFAAVFCVTAFGGSAFAETRALTLYNTHTHERATITFKKNGRYVASGLRDLNRFLRDWRRNESIKMDPRLFDLIWSVYQRTGTSKPIHVVSGYRSPATNNMLRRRSRGVAKFSQHTLGKAMDFFIPGVKSSKIRVIGLQQQVGGVGYYPRSHSKFIHLDTGRVRHWPRMTRRQLVQVFPNGNTLHVPSDGKPLPGYKTALARAKSGKSLAQRSTRVASLTAPTTGSRNSGWDEGVLREKGTGKGFLSALFGGGLDEEEDGGGVEASGGTQVAAAPKAVRTQQVATRRSGPVPPAPVGNDGQTRVALATPTNNSLFGSNVGTDNTEPAPAETAAEPAAPEAPAAAEEPAFVIRADAPPPRPKPVTETAIAALVDDTAIPRLKPAVPTLVASANTAEADATVTATIPRDGTEVAAIDENDTAAVLGYASAVPPSKPGSIFDETRRLADTAVPSASPRPNPRPRALASLKGDARIGADGTTIARSDDPNDPTGRMINAPRLFVDAHSAGTTAFAELYHPDQRSIAYFMSVPARTVVNDFSGNPPAALRMDAFSGTAIAALPTRSIY
ncbi:uncharacterized protein YcbK (DUF882 family) [Rhodobium gokarnense]|uniref:Murein endopeptidase K n=1 Tax=Rhodobium gokarnense TaxID=364296 RepID=A0ABT3H6U7_9HYPH|nr:DUF882 domain-containing protein [Rhodobium gokarnense]MCW2306123.1 uncharacterized protein YcbK (DUF882 family) [Rhodobium gokarnense]